MAVVGEAFIVIKPVTTGFESAVRRDLQKLEGVASRVGSNAGSKFGTAFSQNLSKIGVSSDFAKKIEQQGRALYSLQSAGIVVGTVVSELIGSIAALVGGVVALGGALLSATPAAVALGAGLVDIGIGAAVAKLALSGIGKAVTALNKQRATAAADDTAAKRRVADAEKALIRVIASNGEALKKANKDVEDAANGATKAQIALTAALKDGNEQLQQIGFDAEDAALAEKRAGMDLEKARETLARVQDLPPNSRARREAQLAYAEADLNLRRAKDKNADLAKEQERLAKTGVEGLDSVVAAREAAAQADQAVSDAKDARSKAEVDALQKQKDAEEALRRAQEDAAKGRSSGVADPLAGLTDSQKTFATYIASLKPLINQLKEAAAASFLPKLQEAIQLLVDKAFPTVKKGVAEVGSALGDASITIAQAITEAGNLKDLATVFTNAAESIRKLGEIIGSLWGSFLSILVAVNPLTQRFLDYLVLTTAKWDNFLNVKQKNGELTAFFNEAGRVAAEIGKIIGNIARGLGNIIRANTGPGTGGQIMLDYFKDITGAFAIFSKSESGQNKLKDYFAGAAENTKAILGSVGAFVKEMLKLGSDPNIKKFWDIIKEAAPSFGNIMKMSNAAAPSMGRLFVTVTKILEAFTQTSTIQVFFDTLNTIASVILAIFSSDIIKKILDFTAPIHGLALALFSVGMLWSTFGAGILYIVGKPFSMFLSGLTGIGKAVGFLMNPFAAMSGMLDKLVLGYLKLGPALEPIAASFGLAVGPFLAVVAAIAALVAIFVLAYKSSEDLRNAIGTLVGAVGSALGDAFDKIKAAIGPVNVSLSGMKDVFKAIGDFLAKYIVPIFQGALVLAINLFANAVVLAIKVAKDLWGALTQNPITGIAKIIGDIGSFLINSFRNIWTNIGTALKNIPVFNSLYAGATSVFKWVANAWNNTLGKIKFTVPSWIPGFGGKGFSFPTIDVTNFAEGGIVPARRGGTIARIGEAGRAERVEPLDSNGLSKRDKAMIELLAGGSGGNTINVYPSAGMNESELAAVVSRQIAFQMRKGGS